MDEYCSELVKTIKARKTEFVNSLNRPVLNDPLEYLKSLRYYGLQKNEGKTEYTMMQD